MGFWNFWSRSCDLDCMFGLKIVFSFPACALKRALFLATTAYSMNAFSMSTNFSFFWIKQSFRHMAAKQIHCMYNIYAEKRIFYTLLILFYCHITTTAIIHDFCYRIPSQKLLILIPTLVIYYKLGLFPSCVNKYCIIFMSKNFNKQTSWWTSKI